MGLEGALCNANSNQIKSHMLHKFKQIKAWSSHKLILFSQKGTTQESGSRTLGGFGLTTRLSFRIFLCLSAFVVCFKIVLGLTYTQGWAI